MNCCGGSDVNYDARELSRLIDAEIAKDRPKQKYFRMLLLGAGESGKSTIFKMLQFLQIDGTFTQAEVDFAKTLLRANAVENMKVLLHAASKTGAEFENSKSEANATKVLQSEPGINGWSTETGQAVRDLWNDPAIRKVYAIRDTVCQLDDSASYLFDNTSRFLLEDFSPTPADIVRARSVTRSVHEAEFYFDNLTFRLIDVGGQRCERRKWLPVFDGVNILIFCVAISEYNLVLREDQKQNRLRESLILFDEILNLPCFRNTPILLFLNKVDVFEEKIKHYPLSDLFPDYTGGADFEAAKAFVQNKFLEINVKKQTIYPYFTIAISAECMSEIFATVRHTIVKDVINQF